MKKTIYAFLLFILVSFTAVKGQTIEQLGYYYINGIFALSSKTNLMVLGSGDIINISNPLMPEQIGNISFSGFSTAVLVSEDYAYFGTGMSVKLIIADISNPSFPLQISSLSFPETGGGIFGLAKSDNILYLAMGDVGIYSVDISNITIPSVIDTLLISNGQARDIVTKKSYAYIAHNDGLKILDISNPSNMQLVTSIGSGYNSIDINDSLVFLGKSSGGIDVFNISDPLSPYPAFSIPNSNGTTWDLKYYGNHIYLATNSLGLFIYKIEANSGTEMANFPNTNNGQSFGVCLQDSLILLSGLINGVAILQYDSTGTVSINPLSLKKQIQIFPNPAKKTITILSSSEVKIKEVKLYSQTGQIILQKKAPMNTINISSFQPGLYFVEVVTEQGNVRKKLIIK